MRSKWLASTMDLLGEYLADNDRYAFLLGSALRNDDSEHFFCIYDSIIPKELPDAQVEKIKEEARFIADLPEDKFNELVLNARDFSLARGRPASLPLLAMSANEQELFNSPGGEEEGQVLGTSLITDLDWNASASANGQLASGVKDDDSGLPSSTKTGRPASLSSVDTTEMEDKELQFCPDELKRTEERKKTDHVPRLRELVSVRHSYNPEFDEEVAVEHDNESLESPRSDASSTREYDVTQLDGEDGVEMTTFRSEQCGYVDCDSDDDLHPAPYFSDSWSTKGHSHDSGTSSINFERSSKLLAEGKSISSLRNTSVTSSRVDESVNFSLGGFSTQSSSSPDRVGALSNSSHSPPFGTGKDLLSKVGESVGSLVTPHDLAQSKAEEEPERRKKKQKQKKENKDDGTREGGNTAKLVTKDINQNPSDTEGLQQMHEVHLGEKSCVVSASGRPGSSGFSNNDMGHTQGEDIGGSQSIGKRPRRGKRNARQQGVDVYPDQDKDYYGDIEDVNDLVKFINNDITAENLKKIDGNLKDGDESNLRRVAKKRERKVKSAGADGSCHSSDTLWREPSTSKQTESLNEEVDAKETESETPVDNLGDTDSIGMGNTSSSEKLDINEDEAHPSSSEIIAAEPETSQKIIKNKIQKPESGKKPKNRGPDKMTSSITKQSKNNVEKVKPQLQDHLKDTDAEETKQKNSKKGKSRSAKTDTQRLTNRVSSPSLPATSDLPVDVTGSAEEQWEHCVPKKLQRKMRSQNQTFATVQNYNAAVVNSQTRSKDKQISPSACSFDLPRKGLQQTGHQHTNVRPLSHRPPLLDTVESERREKDLNPSDFPALRSSPRDLRENIFDSGASISDKDSDKESSSSFPTDAGLVSRCNTRHFVSYATMASGNRSLQSAGPSKPERVNFCVEDSNVEFSEDQMHLEWARSPKERRHSIGSAPKELTKSVLQRTGSQEMLPCDKNLRCSPVPFSDKVDNTDDNKLVSSDSTGSFTSSDADSVRGSEVVSKGTAEEFTTSATNTNVTSHSRTPVEIKNSGALAVNLPSSSKVRPEGEKTKSTAKSIPVESTLKSQTHRTTESKISSSGAKPTNNGCKKAVEFFDSRNEMCTPIAGLAFGSFCDHEYASILTHSALNKSSVPINGEPQGDVFSNTLSHSSQRPSAVDPTPADSNVSSSDQTDKPKGPHIGGLNGLVSPQTTNKNPTLVLQTPTQLNSTCSASICSVPAPESTVQGSESHSTTIKRDSIAHGPTLKQYTVCVCPAEQMTSKPAKEWIMSSEYSYGWITSVNFLSEGWVGKNSYREKMMNDGGSWMVQMNELKTTM